MPMKKRKIPSLSYRLYTTFTISFILPVLLVCLCISCLFGFYQFQTIQAQTEQNTQLISAYMSKYILDIDNIMRAPFSHSYMQSKIDLRKLSNVDRNRLSVEIGSTLNMTAYSRDDFGDLLFLSNQEVIYFNAENIGTPVLLQMTQECSVAASQIKNTAPRVDQRGDNFQIQTLIQITMCFKHFYSSLIWLARKSRIILLNVSTSSRKASCP